MEEEAGVLRMGQSSFQQTEEVDRQSSGSKRDHFGALYCLVNIPYSTINLKCKRPDDLIVRWAWGDGVYLLYGMIWYDLILSPLMFVRFDFATPRIEISTAQLLHQILWGCQQSRLDKNISSPTTQASNQIHLIFLSTSDISSRSNMISSRWWLTTFFLILSDSTNNPFLI